MATLRDLSLLRLAAQRIAGPGLASATDAVRWLTAVQGQDYPGALTSIALRTETRSRGGVVEALNSGEVVKSWPMRGTLHFVLGEDLPWMLALTGERMITGSTRRREQIGLDPATLEQARAAAVAALAERRQLSREELMAVWEQSGVGTESQRGYHLIGRLAWEATLCFGPVVDGAQRLVLVSDWVPAPRRLERDEALGEWALRYFRSHGPATVKDFSRWTDLLAADVRTGVAAARPRLEALEVDGVEYLMDPETPALLDSWRDSAEGTFLLPGFDEYLLGYQDRRASLAAEFASLIVPGNNGMFRPTVVAGGQVVGTWKRSPRNRKQPFLATPFEAFPAAVEEALPQLHASLP